MVRALVELNSLAIACERPVPPRGLSGSALSASSSLGSRQPGSALPSPRTWHLPCNALETRGAAPARPTGRRGIAVFCLDPPDTARATLRVSWLCLRSLFLPDTSILKTRTQTSHGAPTAGRRPALLPFRTHIISQAMSRASRSDTPERAVRAPPSPLSVSSVSPPAPACEGGDRAPPNPASADDECCCVCLERLQPAALANQLPVPFPTCRRHRMHLRCLAQSRAQANGPHDLLCPLCRHSRCPDCVQCGWSGFFFGLHDELLRSQCRREGVVMPERISGETTVQQAVHDYQLRTFTSSDAPEPRAPPGVVVLCCHGLAAIGRADGVDFVRLSHREMQWAPVPSVAPRLALPWMPFQIPPIPADAEGPCHRCGSAFRWEFDGVTGLSSWSCTAGCTGPAAPLDAPPLPAPAPHAAT